MSLCLHTLRADCNVTRQRVQHSVLSLCLHTLRADCNRRAVLSQCQKQLCLHTLRADCNAVCLAVWLQAGRFASTRSVQIATQMQMANGFAQALCLHTLRADCNAQRAKIIHAPPALPPHAPCRLQQRTRKLTLTSCSLPPHAPCRLQHSCRSNHRVSRDFASTRSVQIAT